MNQFDVFVLCGGKCGGSTLNHTFQINNMKSFHIHGNGYIRNQLKLDMNVFDTPKNEWTYKKYLDAKSDPTGYIFLATGRLDKAPGMIDAVQRILDHYGFKFDDIFLNWGEDTFMFKIKLFEKMITKTGCRHFIMYDDRKDHLPNFEKWAANQNCAVSVVDVVNKIVKTF